LSCVDGEGFFAEDVLACVECVFGVFLSGGEGEEEEGRGLHKGGRGRGLLRGRRKGDERT